MAGLFIALFVDKCTPFRMASFSKLSLLTCPCLKRKRVEKSQAILEHLMTFRSSISTGKPDCDVTGNKTKKPNGVSELFLLRFLCPVPCALCPVTCDLWPVPCDLTCDLWPAFCTCRFVTYLSALWQMVRKFFCWNTMSIVIGADYHLIRIIIAIHIFPAWYITCQPVLSQQAHKLKWFTGRPVVSLQ